MVMKRRAMETTKRIEEYLEGRLNEEDRRAFGDMAEHDADLRELIRMHKEANESIRDKEFSDFTSILGKVSDDYFRSSEGALQSPDRKILKWTQKSIFQVAAILIVILASGIIIRLTLFGELPTEKLFQKYYEPYKSDMVLRSASEDGTSLDRATVAYINGECMQALSILE